MTEDIIEFTKMIDTSLRTMDEEAGRAANDIYDTDAHRWIRNESEWAHVVRDGVTNRHTNLIERLAAELIGPMVNASPDGVETGAKTVGEGDVWKELRRVDRAVATAEQNAPYNTAGDPAKRSLAETRVSEAFARAKRAASANVNGGTKTAAGEHLQSYYKSASPEEKAIFQDRRESLLAELPYGDIKENIARNQLRQVVQADYEARIASDPALQKALDDYQRTSAAVYAALDTVDRAATKLGKQGGSRYIDHVAKAFSFEGSPQSVTFARNEFNAYGPTTRPVERYSVNLSEKADMVGASTTRRVLTKMRARTPEPHLQGSPALPGRGRWVK